MSTHVGVCEPMPVSTIFVVSWPRLENEITDKFGSLWKTLYVLPLHEKHECRKAQGASMCNDRACSEVLFLSIAGGLDWGAAADLFIRTENYIATSAQVAQERHA